MKLLFVCTGNICRSPTAEAVMRHMLTSHPDIKLDSAGIQSFHTGAEPDLRTQEVARKKGVTMGDLRGRQLTFKDFDTFDMIFGMDQSHVHWMKALAPKKAQKKIHLYLEYARIKGTREVPDPYYGRDDGFEEVFDLIEQATKNIIKKLKL